MILIILFIIRLPVFIFDYPLLVPELTWQLIGEKMSDGFILHRDIWTALEPFSASVYACIDFFWGRSVLVYHVLSFVLIFVQAMVFNLIANTNNLYSDRTYVPALLYISFSSLFFDFYTLSPPMLGMIFILSAIHLILLQIRVSEDDETLFYTGALIAVASLFYFPFLVFLLLAILSLILYTGTILRRYFLLITGFVFPYMLVGFYYYYRGGFIHFLSSLYVALFSDTELMVSGNMLGTALIVPVAIIIAAILVISANARYINYQYIAIRIFSFWLILSALTLYFARTLSTFHLFVFIPPLTFFGTHLFLLIKNKLPREIGFAACLVVILAMNYKVLYEFIVRENSIAYDQIVVKDIPEAGKFTNKKLLVLGNNRTYYNHNHIATPYFNWELAQSHFNDLNSYYNLSQIYSNFIKDMPEVIIDENNIIPFLFYRLPHLKDRYTKQPGKNIYIIK